MSCGPVSFKQRDMARAIKAAQAAGLTVRAIDVAKGMILLGDDLDSVKASGLKSWADAIAQLKSRQ